MSTNPKAEIHKDRADKASLAQNRASNPDAHIWVMASAGTGKTTVLVSRFIRLVLQGTPADKILCLTYTKAAATQMKERILSRLGSWVCMEDDALEKELTFLLNHIPNIAETAQARQLFGDFLDQLDRLNIMTIHAFCHSLLARFPFEAEIDSGVDMLDDAKASVMLNGIFKTLLELSDAPYFDRLSHYISDSFWLKNMDLIINNRAMFRDFLTHFNTPQETIYQSLNLPNNPPSPIEYMNEVLSDKNLPLELLKNYTTRGVSFIKKKDTINSVLAKDPKLRYYLYNNYCNCFLTTKFVAAKDKPIDDDTYLPALEQERERLVTAHDTLTSLYNAQLTIDLCALARDMLSRYDEQKAKQGVVDFQDLIQKTLDLLTRKDAAEWIKYKLDGGLEQVLVDEAQDTGPMQWRIIGQMIEEYFSGQGRDHKYPRTIFAVGDIKQSIYSFQGADPQSMALYHNAFEHDAQAAKQKWDNVPLDTSFRTAQDILDVVDVISHNTWGATTHVAGKTQVGRVELWPALEYNKGKKTEIIPWSEPEDNAQTNNKSLLINQVADHIQEIIEQRIAIPSKNGRGVEARDILILVKNRTHYPASLIQALRKRNIPISGLDRFNLNEDTSIKDIICLIQWALFPNDDLSLATLLKSPFIGWNDDQLSKVALHRHPKSLFHALQDTEPEIHKWLSAIRHLIIKQPIEVTLRQIIDAPCPAAPNKSVLYAFQERLGPSCVDALEQWLDFVDALDVEYKSALAFLDHMNSHDHDIKRELEGENASGVRIMTIHGAKGLEAPIVYLIDTLFTTSSIEKVGNLQWIDHKDGGQTPLWATKNEFFGTPLKEAINIEKTKQREEYYRLLYVAMTRAKDGLFVMGAHPYHAADPQSWYHLIKEGMEELGAQSIADTLVYGSWDMKSSVVDYEAKDSQAIDDDHKNYPAYALPIHDDNEDEEPQEKDDDDLSHLGKALSIGVQWHKLMERAMIEPTENWKSSMPLWLSDLPDIETVKALEVLANLRAHKTYGFLFETTGAVEVPFIVKNNDDFTRGRIDRLVETNEAFWIIDYKTTLNMDDDPLMDKYKNQLKGYKSALQYITGGKPIHIILVDIMKASIVELD